MPIPARVQDDEDADEDAEHDRVDEKPRRNLARSRRAARTRPRPPVAAARGRGRRDSAMAMSFQIRDRETEKLEQPIASSERRPPRRDPNGGRDVAGAGTSAARTARPAGLAASAAREVQAHDLLDARRQSAERARDPGQRPQRAEEAGWPGMSGSSAAAASIAGATRASGDDRPRGRRLPTRRRLTGRGRHYQPRLRRRASPRGTGAPPTPAARPAIFGRSRGELRRDLRSCAGGDVAPPCEEGCDGRELLRADRAHVPAGRRSDREIEHRRRPPARRSRTTSVPATRSPSRWFAGDEDRDQPTR